MSAPFWTHYPKKSWVAVDWAGVGARQDVRGCRGIWSLRNRPRRRSAKLGPSYTTPWPAVRRHDALPDPEQA